MNTLRSAPAACLVAVLVAACAGPAAHPALDQAHAAVERARSAPRVRALAPAELDLAEIALEQAGAAARSGAPRTQVEHLAYVASQRAALAEARAAAQAARSETRLLRRALIQTAVEASLQDRPTPRLPRDDAQTTPLSRIDQQAKAPLEADQQDHASVEADQRPATVEPDAVTAEVETTLQDITLSLAELAFEGAEPTDEALEKLAVLAERLLREPGRNLWIEADFDLPEPEARTMMERRVEVVRAILLERGVVPARLVVRAAGNRTVEPQVPSSFVESSDLPT